MNKGKLSERIGRKAIGAKEFFYASQLPLGKNMEFMC